MNRKIDRQKEDEKMCDRKCQYPEKLKGKPEECSFEQPRKCHGDTEHPCDCGDKKEKEEGNGE